MNRQLYLVRHAQTHLGQPDSSDKLRELKQEGIAQAKSLGQYLMESNHQIDLIVSSDAERAKSTALLIASALNYPLQQIKFVEKIYSGTWDDQLQLIRQIPDKMKKVMMVGHYPTILEVNNYLTLSNKTGVSTGELNIIEISVSWQTLTKGCGKCISDYHPIG